MDIDEIMNKIKAYADAAIDQAGKLGKAAAARTETVVTKAKLRYVINETEGHVKDVYTALGEKVYKKHLDGADVCDDLAEDCEKIASLMAEIEDLKTQLADLNESVKCESCGAYNSSDSDFCSKCGAKLPVKPAEDDGVPEAVADAEEAVEAAVESAVDAAFKAHGAEE